MIIKRPLTIGQKLFEVIIKHYTRNLGNTTKYPVSGIDESARNEFVKQVVLPSESSKLVK